MGAAITMDEHTTPQVLIEALREQCLKRGCGGIKGLGLVFKNMDIDYSKRIVFEELRIGLQRYGILMSENFLKSLFNTLDRDNSGGIDFQEFMKALRPPMNQGRINVVNETFDLLDADHDGLLKIEDLKVRFSDNVKCHPKFLSGEWTEEETLRSFLDTIDDQNNPDGVVTREEFLDYYAGVSALYDDDAYFDLTMRASYGLPKKGSNNNRK
ncbi:calcyphosin-like protein isoform X2 [Argopecten irradians]|uniref:calcyphosin-like protein isoform X2 n=2 Tax=Argopecten irradians TaxID=31199 RepID=UPI003721EAD9